MLTPTAVWGAWQVGKPVQQCGPGGALLKSCPCDWARLSDFAKFFTVAIAVEPAWATANVRVRTQMPNERQSIPSAPS